MGSTRLPGKILFPILDKPVLWHIVQRLNNVNSIDKIIIATSDTSSDDRVYDFCSEYNIESFRGSENDVLDRFYQAAVKSGAHIVMRITGDCPLTDPELIEKLIHYFRESDLNYCGIATGAGVIKEKNQNRYPDGLDAEIFDFTTLETAWKEATLLLHREHVTPYIWKNPTKFKIGSFKSENKDYSEYRWTLDSQEDFDLISWIYEELYPVNNRFSMSDILDLLNSNPDKFRTNKNLIGKEGYDEFWK